jgi:hypothetical protein
MPRDNLADQDFTDFQQLDPWRKLTGGRLSTKRTLIRDGGRDSDM